MAEEFELPEFNPRERAKQQISVPFLWEVKPGAPKRDWVISKPAPPVFSSCPSPLKHVVSVPFQWEEKPGKPLQLQDASPLHVPSDHHAGFSASPYSLNPFVAEGEEEYTLGFDLEAFGFPDDSKASGIAEYMDGSSRRGTWYSFSDSEDYSNSSGNTSARESQFPRAPSEQSWEVANDDDHQQNKPRSPPRSAFTLEELMMLSRKLGCGQGFSTDDVRKKSLSSSSLSSVELIKKFLIVCS